MAEIPFFPRCRSGGHGNGRLGRGMRRTARAGWVGVKVLAYASMGAGAAVGGASMVASGANILTSPDRVLLVMGTAAPSIPDRDPYSARDPFSTRREPQPTPTPEESVCLTRWEALLTFGMGLFVALFSLVGFAAAWSEAAEALGFDGRGVKPNGSGQ